MINPNIVGAIESGNNENALGPETKYGRAKYDMQVLETTANNPGFGITPAREDTPKEYRRIGTELLAAFEKIYGEDSPVVLMAYNWGPGNTKKWVEGGMQWSKVPKETQMYIGRYMLERVKRQ